jgi:hypothetical protein
MGENCCCSCVAEDLSERPTGFETLCAALAGAGLVLEIACIEYLTPEESEASRLPIAILLRGLGTEKQSVAIQQDVKCKS